MSGKTSETRCKHCQQEIKFVNGLWYSSERLKEAIDTAGVILAGICSSNSQFSHVPTPSEGEAVPEQVTMSAESAIKCGMPLGFSGYLEVYCNENKPCPKHAPVVSTAAPEPPITEMYLCETERLFLKPDQLYKFVVHPTCQRCSELSKIVAPESYKPAEGQRDQSKRAWPCPKCALKNNPACGHTYHTDPDPAATPVTVEAPKVEEVKADNLFGVYCNGKSESVPKDRAIYWEGWQRVADYVNRLRPYFPPASQKSEKVEVSPAVYGNLVAIWQTALMLFSGSPDELPNVENMRRRMHEAATPKPIGDVEAVAGKLYGQLAYVDIGMVDWLKKAAAILSPFFAPAGPENKEQK